MNADWMRVGWATLWMAAVATGQDGMPFRIQHLDLESDWSTLDAGDFDEDGWTDLLVQRDAGLFIALNDGQGGLPPTLDELVLVPDSAGTNGVTIADLDGDGHLDLVGALFDEDLLRIAFGSGDASFSGAVELGTPGRPRLTDVGDLDVDGDLDVVVLAPLSLRARSFENLGDRRLVGAGNTSISSVVYAAGFGDFDEDGDLDLAYLDEALEAVTLVAGSAGVGFLGSTSFDMGEDPSDLAIGDLDGDGHLDLLTGSRLGANSVRYRRGDGSGSLLPLGELPVTDDPSAPVLADLDEDGLIDLIVALEDQGVAVLPGIGPGQFGSAQTTSIRLNASHLVTVDLDRDGDLDVVVRHIFPGTLSALFGRGDRTFEDRLPVGDLPRDVAAGDLDGDGRADLVAACWDDLWVLAARGAGRFDEAAEIPTPALGVLTEVELGDLDGDGDLDALVGEQKHELWTVSGQGDGSFDAPILAATVGDSGSFLRDVRLAEFDGDGTPDIALIGENTTQVLLGAGDGTFGVPTAWLASAHGIAVGDVDADGFLDLVTQRRIGHGAATLDVQLGDGQGGFAPAVTTTTALTSAGTGDGVALGDVDDDGLLDALHVSGLTMAECLLGQGDGTFVHGALVDHPYLADLTLRLVDVSDDGQLDLLSCGRSSGGALTLNLGAGDGTFGDALLVSLPAEAYGAALVDADQDGSLDVAVAVGTTSGSGYLLRQVAIVTNRKGVWSELGHPLAGGHGTPTFRSGGTLTAGSPIDLMLTDARPDATAWLVVGLSGLSAPFKGGLLLPFPDLLLPVPLDGAGDVALAETWPAGLPSGAELWWQWWIDDPAAPVGWSASNGRLASLP